MAVKPPGSHISGLGGGAKASMGSKSPSSPGPGWRRPFKMLAAAAAGTVLLAAAVVSVGVVSKCRCMGLEWPVPLLVLTCDAQLAGIDLLYVLFFLLPSL